ncbi:WD40/YVTN repeat-like-containing domain superfamily [Sesbania bispinosa]|nr:WD40/YVTN repeat-like-containing domain superfamily [Sesbania bispinosa]
MVSFLFDLFSRERFTVLNNLRSGPNSLRFDPLRLEIKRKLAQRSERVKSVDLHPTEPWILASLYSGTVCIWNYQSQTMAKSFEVTELPGADDMFIRVYNYNTMDKVKVFEAHTDYIRCVAVHPTLPYVLSSSDDMLISFGIGRRLDLYPDIEGHSHYVMQVTFNPKDTNTFASASLDRTIKVWDYQTKSCVQTLEGHTHNVSAVCFHPELPIIITGSEDGTVRIWHSTTYRLENTLNYGLERVWAIGYLKGSRRVGRLAMTEGTIMIKLGREEPVASMDNSGKSFGLSIMKFKLLLMEKGYQLAVKELGTCDLYPQSFGSALEFVWSSDGEYAVRESTSKKNFSKNFQEKKSIRPTFSAERIFGGTVLAMCSNDFICFYDWAECRLIRRIDVNVKNSTGLSGDLVTIASDTSFYILKYNRDVVASYLDSGSPVDEQGVEDAFELLHEMNERVRTGIWVGDCFIYNNSSWRLNYCVGGEVTTMFHLDRPMYLLGYLASQSRVYLIDKEFNVMGSLLLSLIEYKTLVMRDNYHALSIFLPVLASSQCGSFPGITREIEDALEVDTDPDYRFDLAIQLGRLEVAKGKLYLMRACKEISLDLVFATEVQSESKWKQLGELAMSTGKLEMAEECLKYAMDLSGLLLLYSSLGDAEGISKLATLAKEQGKNNVAFLCLIYVGNRIPEAALMARSYLPSKVSEIVAIWRKDLSKVNPKAAESLADPEEYPNLFEDWQVALAVESKAAETSFQNLQIEEGEQPLENGDSNHELTEQNGEDYTEEHEEQNGEEGSQEEAVVVDADSNDGAVIINGNEADEEWGDSGASKSDGSGFSTLKEVVVETSEENEKVVFNADSILFEFVDGSWKERGNGELKVNVTSGTEKARLLMRSRGNYRLVLNARIFPDMKLTYMENKGVTFACINSATEGKDGLSTFALKFKDGSIVEEFKAAITAHKGEAATVLKTPKNSPKASDV